MTAGENQSRWQVVVGLGNPEGQYARTRHNLGFRVCDAVARQRGAAFDRDRFESLVAEVATPRGRLLLLKPQTFMNLSGRAVAAAVRFYQLELENVLVVCDDFNLELGQLRLRPGGSDGGHNGLRNVSELLGTEEFPRLRLGTGPLAGREAVSFCLNEFAPAERPVVEELVETAAQAVEAWLDVGIAEAMNRFNARGASPSQEDTAG